MNDEPPSLPNQVIEGMSPREPVILSLWSIFLIYPLWSSCRVTTEHQRNWWFHLKNLTEFPPLLCLCIIIPNFDPSNYGAKRKKTQFHSIAMQFKMWSLRGSDFQRKCRKSVLKWWQLGQTFLWLSYSPFGMESSIFVSQLWFSSSICCVYVIQLYSTGISTTGWAFRF